MITLNLVYPKTSENKTINHVTYRIDRFPDKQQQVVIDLHGRQVLSYENRYKNGVTIKSRFNSFMDLELITCAVKSLRNLGVKEIHLYTPYFLGSRSDIKFEEGSNNYLKDVMCPQINNLNLESVTVLDPHSTVLEGCLNNFRYIDNHEVVESFLSGTNTFLSKLVLVAPDGGSLKKIYKVAEKINYTNDIVTCSKHRGVDGKITHTNVPVNIAECEGKDFVIIDDICDGGRTFIEIAKEIKKKISDYNVACGNDVIKSKIYLVVSHGIFSKGFGELMQYFEAIYTTNSYQDFMPDTKQFIKQLNVF